MNKKVAGLGVAVFFFFPWLGFVLSLFNLKSKFSGFIYVFFSILFGFAISFSDMSADSYRYAQSFAQFDNTLDYNKIIQLYRDGELRDLYRLLLFYFSAIFTKNPKIMYAFAGLFYGVFSYLSFRLFDKETSVKRDRYTLILALVFFTYISLANINGFRFWTGALVFFYATYNFVMEKSVSWALGIVVTPFFHYGFILIVPIILVYGILHRFLCRRRGFNKTLYLLFVTSFFASWFLKVNSIDLGFLLDVDNLSGEVGDRLSYINSDEVSNRLYNKRENSLFLGVQEYFLHAIKIYVFIMITFLNKYVNRISNNNVELKNHLSLVMFFYAFAFIATSFPSGGRFLNIAHLLFVLAITKSYKLFRSTNFSTLILLALPVFSFHIAFINFMIPTMILSPVFWYGNIFWILIDGIAFTL